MTLQPLRSALQKQTAGGKPALVLQAMADANMPAPSAVAASMTLEMAVATDVSVSGAAVQPGGDSPVVVTGTADVLGLKGAAITVTYTASSANAWPDVQIVVTPPAGWTLGKSFPTMAGTGPDKLTLNQPLLIFTTATGTAYAWTDGAGQAHTSVLSPGLNFIADLVPSDTIAILAGVLSGGTSNLHVPMAGTIDSAPLKKGAPSPAVLVQGPIGRSLLPATSFTLGAPEIEIANDPTQLTGATSMPRVLLAVPVMSSGQPLLMVSAPIAGVGKGLSLLVAGANGGLTLEQVTSLVLGEQITANLPDFLQAAFQTIAFKAFSLELDTPSMKPSRIGVSVGTVVPWGVAEFMVNSTTLSFTVTDPLGTKSTYRSFSADVSIFPTVFKGTFDLLVENDAEQTSVSAAFTGDVTLNDLISGMSNGQLQIPPQIFTLTFSDFGFGFTRTGAGWDWQMYGKSDATFPLPFVSGSVDAQLVASVSSLGGQRAYNLLGTLAIGTSFFSVTLVFGPSGHVLTAKWEATAGDGLGFADIAGAVGLPPPAGIPPELDLSLTSAELQYDFDTRSLMLTATSTHYGEALFVAVSSTEPALYAFGLSIDLGVRLADIPLVGSKIPDGQNLGIDTATAWILSRAATKAEVAVLNARAADAKFPPLPDGDIAAPVVLAAQLKVGTGDPVPLRLALGGTSAQTPPAPPAGLRAIGDGASSAPAVPAAPASGGDTTVWLNVQRTFGPFTFNRVGIGYDPSPGQGEPGRLRFALDAGIALGPFSLSMSGLSIASPLTAFRPTFDLAGLGISFSRPPLEITGALLKLPGSQLAPDLSFQFDGMVILKTSELAISGIGSYAQFTDGDPSLFIFAQLQMPLGGPPAFFVTGLMAGVGFNRSLVIPGMDQVQAFPLLTLGQPPAPGQPAAKQDPMQALEILEGQVAGPGGVKQQWIAPKPGAFWFAAGIQFTSFKLANTKAMLIVEDSDTLTVALLGLTTIQLPLPEQNTSTYAFAELQIRMVLQPEEGSFMASAILSSSSYVLTPDCHLTGGFAFGFWFGDNPHAGDFVVTLGGYHPAFTPPSYYPTVPRLGFNWAVSDTVSIKGDAYFALTPSCAMGGGGLEVLFHDGDLNAWFTAHADVLISWRPFFFTAEIDVSIGVSYRLNLLVCHKTISVSVGASVDLWGPPTGGRVHVHLVVVSFTVSFGSTGAGTAEKPLQWTEMKALLPPPSAICTITAQGALGGTAESTTSTSQRRWFVRPRGFSFATQSAIPSSALTHNGASALTAENAPAPTIAIKPMNVSDATSTHALTITHDSPTGAPVNTAGWDFEPRAQTVPDALWGAPPQPFTQIPATPSSKTIPNQPVGYTVAIPGPALGAEVGAVPFQELLEEYILPAGQSPLSRAATTTGTYVPAPSAATIAQITAAASGVPLAQRTAIATALGGAQLFTAPAGTFAVMAAKAAHLFTDAPMQQG